MAIWNRSKSGGDGDGPKRVEPPRPVEPVDHAERQSSLFRLGPATTLRGELVGDTDVEIAGLVDGRVRVERHAVTVTESGKVTAEIFARTVVVRGRVAGNVTATEAISIDRNGSVLGDICAPSIALAEGSSFTGSINKGSPPAKVTGELGGGSLLPEVPAGGTISVKGPEARRNPEDRRGQTRPWGTGTNRRSTGPAPEPTTTA